MNRNLMRLFSLVGVLLIVSFPQAIIADENIIAGENTIGNEDNNSLYIATQDEETGETIYSEISIGSIDETVTGTANVVSGASVSPNSIIGGVDNRVQITNTTQFPYSSVCYILAGFDTDNDDIADSYLSGSGSLIGPNTVATAAHIIYTEEAGWAKSVTVYPGKNGDSNPFGSSSYKKIIKSGYYNSTYNYPTHADWALIELKTP